MLGPVLGKGGFCSVRKALHQLTGQIVACKIIEKGKLKVRPARDSVERLGADERVGGGGRRHTLRVCYVHVSKYLLFSPHPRTRPARLHQQSPNRTPRTATAWTASAA